MAFDLGFNFRDTADYVTDGAEGVPVLAEAYPHTYTNGNGDSINAGWTAAPDWHDNRQSGNDPRIAGRNYRQNGFPGGPLAAKTFQVALGSGSAPGAGTYTVDLAMGDPISAYIQHFQLLDDATVLIDGLNGDAGYATDAGHYIDASLADVAATTTWTGTTVSKAFASTTANLTIGNPNGSNGSGSYSILAHFRLTLEEGGGTEFPQSVADTVSLSEAVTQRTGKALADALSLTEDFHPQTRKTILETVALTESLVRQLARPLAETLGLTEDLAAVKVAVKALADTVTLTENLQRVIQKASDLGETVALTETVTRLMARVVAETVDLTETHQREARKTLGELASFTEQLVATVIQTHEMAEDVVLTETQQRQIGKALQETLGLTETRFVAIARRVSETVILAEQLQALLVPSGGFVQIVRFTQEAFAMPEVRAESFRIGA